MVAPNPIAVALRAFLRDNPQGVRERVLVSAFVEMHGLPREDLDRVLRSFTLAGWITRDGEWVKPGECIL